MPTKRKTTKRPKAKAKSKRRTKGLSGYQRYIKASTKSESARIKRLETDLKEAKRKKAAKVKKATKTYRSKNK